MLIIHTYSKYIEIKLKKSKKTPNYRDATRLADVSTATTKAVSITISLFTS